MSLIEEYRSDVLELTTEYLDKLIGEIYSIYGFRRMFIVNEYEGEGISNTQLAFSEEDGIILTGVPLQIYTDLMVDSDPVEMDESDRDGICVTFEMLMYNTYGFDWVISAEEKESRDGVRYTVHVLDSDNLDF